MYEPYLLIPEKQAQYDPIPIYYHNARIPEKNVTAGLLFWFTDNKYDIGTLLTITQITNTYIHTLIVCVFLVQRKILGVNFKKEFGNIFPIQGRPNMYVYYIVSF